MTVILGHQQGVCETSRQSRGIVSADLTSVSYTLPEWPNTLCGDATFEAHSLEEVLGTQYHSWIVCYCCGNHRTTRFHYRQNDDSETLIALSLLRCHEFLISIDRNLKDCLNTYEKPSGAAAGVNVHRRHCSHDVSFH